jgi:hypothetical protein
VNSSFSRRQGEDQPAMTRVNKSETEDIAEKCAIRISVLTVDNHVSANDHLPLRKPPGIPILPYVSVEFRKPNRD